MFGIAVHSCMVRHRHRERSVERNTEGHHSPLREEYGGCLGSPYLHQYGCGY